MSFEEPIDDSGPLRVEALGTDADTPAPESLRRKWAAEEDELAMRARFSPTAFMEYVLKEEETNLSITLQPMHREWQMLSNEYRRLLIWSHIESGKTQGISIGRVLWEIGRNTNLRIVVLSNTAKQAEKIVSAIAKYIVSSTEYHKVFPHVKPAEDRSWSRGCLYVERDTKAKDPSIQATGVHGNVLGSRIDLLILDDILDHENTRTHHQREELDKWVRSTLFGRLTKLARIIAVGTAWHPDDFYHRLAKMRNWLCVKYPLVDEFGRSTWPSRWPPERIAQVRAELGAVEAARQLELSARADEEARFRKAWIDQCLEQGEGRTLAEAINFIPSGYSVFTGVDLSMGTRKDKGDLTSLFTILLHPDETREVLDIVSGRWKGPEIVKRIIDIHYRYQSIVMVENNQAQEFIVQFTKQLSAVPIKGFHTGSNKVSPEFGIESVATEMEAGKWVIPSRHGEGATPEIRAWVNEMLYYDPEGHTGDRLMACWFAREAARLSRKPKPKMRSGRLDTVSRGI